MTDNEKAFAFVLTLACAALVHGDDRGSVPSSVARAAKGAPNTGVSRATSKLEEALVSIQDRRGEAVVKSDIFAALDFSPPTPPPPVVVAPPRAVLQF